MKPSSIRGYDSPGVSKDRARMRLADAGARTRVDDPRPPAPGLKAPLSAVRVPNSVSAPVKAAPEIVVEPWLETAWRNRLWLSCFLIGLVLCGFVAFRYRKSAPLPQPPPVAARPTANGRPQTAGFEPHPQPPPVEAQKQAQKKQAQATPLPPRPDKPRAHSPAADNPRPDKLDRLNADLSRVPGTAIPGVFKDANLWLAAHGYAPCSVRGHDGQISLVLGVGTLSPQPLATALSRCAEAVEHVTR